MLKVGSCSCKARAYFYLKVWENPEHAMIHIDNPGNYTIKPFYYVIKHWAKRIASPLIGQLGSAKRVEGVYYKTMEDDISD